MITYKLLAYFVFWMIIDVRCETLDQPLKEYCEAVTSKDTTDPNDKLTKQQSCLENTRKGFFFANATTEAIQEFVNVCASVGDEDASVLCGNAIEDFLQKSYSFAEAMSYIHWLSNKNNVLSKLPVCPKDIWKILKDDKLFDLQSRVGDCISSDTGDVKPYISSYAYFKKIHTTVYCIGNNVKIFYEIYLKISNFSNNLPPMFIAKKFWEPLCGSELLNPWTTSQLSSISSVISNHNYMPVQILDFLSHPISETTFELMQTNEEFLMELLYNKLAPPKGLQYDINREIALLLLSFNISSKHLDELILLVKGNYLDATELKNLWTTLDCKPINETSVRNYCDNEFEKWMQSFKSTIN